MHGRFAIGFLFCALCALGAMADPPAKPPNPDASDSAGKSPARHTQGEGRGRSSGLRYGSGVYWSDPLWLVCPPPYWYYYPPPLFLPAETLYGPQAVRRFFGMTDSGGGGSVSSLSTSSAAPARAPEVKKEVEPRVANAETRGLAWRFITFGDVHFANNKSGEAYQRYRKAAEIVPELADAYFRQGFALVGTGRYELAAKSLRRGLALEPAWPRSGFRMGDLYAGNQPAKSAHLEALAVASEKDPNNADLLFLLGVFLHFDGQRTRAALFFERAAQLAGQADYLKGFLDMAAKN